MTEELCSTSNTLMGMDYVGHSCRLIYLPTMQMTTLMLIGSDGRTVSFDIARQFIPEKVAKRPGTPLWIDGEVRSAQEKRLDKESRNETIMPTALGKIPSTPENS